MTAIAESNVSELVCVIHVTRGRCKAGCPVPLSVLLVSRTNAINCDHDDDSNTKFNLRRRRRRPTRVVLRHGDRFTAVIVAPPTEFVSKFTYLMKCFVGLPTRLLHQAGRVFKWRLKAVSVETVAILWDWKWWLLSTLSMCVGDQVCVCTITTAAALDRSGLTTWTVQAARLSRPRLPRADLVWWGVCVKTECILCKMFYYK